MVRHFQASCPLLKQQHFVTCDISEPPLSLRGGHSGGGVTFPQHQKEWQQGFVFLVESQQLSQTKMNPNGNQPTQPETNGFVWVPWVQWFPMEVTGFPVVAERLTKSATASAKRSAKWRKRNPKRVQENDKRRCQQINGKNLLKRLVHFTKNHSGGEVAPKSGATTAMVAVVPASVAVGLDGKQRLSSFDIGADLTKGLKPLATEVFSDCFERFQAMKQMKPSRDKPKLEWAKPTAGTRKKRDCTVLGGPEGVLALEEAIDALMCNVRVSMGLTTNWFTWCLGHLETLIHNGSQLPHVDCEWLSIDKKGTGTRGRCRRCGLRRQCACPHEMRVPFSVVIPLDPAGCWIEVWPEVDLTGGLRGMSQVPSEIIHIPCGQGFVFRGDVVHAGGLGDGNMRVHMCLCPVAGTTEHTNHDSICTFARDKVLQSAESCHNVFVHGQAFHSLRS